MKGKNLLPQGDHTPPGYQLPRRSKHELVKRLIRRFIYPAYIGINGWFLRKRYSFMNFQFNLLLWGQRGNDYERHRLTVNRLLTIGGKKVLVAGCGTSKDFESWIKYRPKAITGVDWFSYDQAWNLLKGHFRSVAPETEINFVQADLANLSQFQDASFDIVSSDAVFEHLKNLPEVLVELHRVLKPGGILYSTFGPLWFSYGGDHVSGYDQLSSGYNHLLLGGNEYQRYLDGMGEFIHSEDDGRTWIRHDLFSKLTPRQYLHFLDSAGFKRLYVSAIVDPLAIECLKNPKIKKQLVDKFELSDLIVSGMTIIYQR
jgi:ubiquinone/menaquinone biosynthesis C-methylase UbiE